jgi:Icc-related predicted phosphoesterase
MQSERILVHTGEIPAIEGFVRFVCLSDTHNLTKNMVVPPGDVLLHSGDFSSMGNKSEIIDFNLFLSRLPHRNKLIIAGNHDLTFDLENFESLKRNFQNLRNLDAPVIKSLLKDCIYLEDSFFNVAGYKIYGSPWTPTFFNWGFNLDRGEPIAAKWELIPRDTDILMTHGPPLGYLDVCSDGFSAGCSDLLNKVLDIKPLVHLFGHIHEGYGVGYNDHTAFINASNCTLRYVPKNPPLVFDLPIRN